VILGQQESSTGYSSVQKFLHATYTYASGCKVPVRDATVRYLAWCTANCEEPASRRQFGAAAKQMWLRTSRRSALFLDLRPLNEQPCEDAAGALASLLKPAPSSSVRVRTLCAAYAAACMGRGTVPVHPRTLGAAITALGYCRDVTGKFLLDVELRTCLPGGGGS
jgi:hypothetical protein